MSIYSALIILLVFITVIALIVTNSNTNKAVTQTKQTQQTIVSSLDDHKQELKEIKNLIKLKQKELENLVHATEQAKRRTVTNLTVEQEEAIDLYERNNIRLPIDIIEELSYSNNVTYHSAVAFIEMQRKVWKAQFTVTMTKGMI
ncbi:DNA replication organizer [Bacillus phage MG-B1]|uniref:DNA replication organizer n=1 Tax=Bacillus phage MG-B1 TaxID=1309583 RepID=M4WNK5_9CAUD|nr:GP16.7-like replication protein [Bacillus phage MG-B1]AGI10631.1 DNA replication organizer [Bacillus phage MG-B1]